MGKNDARPSTSKEARMETRSKCEKKQREERKRRKLTEDLIRPTNNDIILTGQEGIVKLEVGENPSVVFKQEEDSSQQEMEVVGDSTDVKVENSDQVRFVTEEMHIKPENLEETIVAESSERPVKGADVGGDDNGTAADFQFLPQEICKLKNLLTQSRLENKVLNDRLTQLELTLGLSNGEAFIVQESPSSSSLLDNHNQCNPSRRPDEQFSHQSENLEEGQGSQLTNDLVEEEKNLTLFDEVLKVVLAYRLQSNPDWRLLSPLLSSCRLVCKSWKDSVNRVLQDHPCHYDLKAYRDRDLGFAAYRKQRTPCTVKMVFKGPEGTNQNIERFTQIFKRQQALYPSYNPIATRHLHLTIRNNERLCKPAQNSFPMEKWTEFSQNVTNYLRAFGKQVWHLSLDYLCLEETRITVTMFKSICQWLQLLPNLKSLAYYVNCSGSRMMQEIEKNQEEFPIPHWTNLVTFQNEGYYCPLDYYVLRNNQHIEKLRLACVGPTIFLRGIELENLAELSVYQITMEEFRNLASAEWKIRKLTISFLPRGGISMDGIATALAKFKTNLQSLNLDLSNLNNIGNLGETVLSLPKLKKLHLKHKVWGTVLWENFLQELTQLETLELEMDRSTFPNISCSENTVHPRTRNVGVWNDINRAHQPSFWTNFPKIRRICFNLGPGECGIRKHTCDNP